MTGWRPHLESALCLDLRHLMKQGATQPGCTLAGSLHWRRDGQEVAGIRYQSVLGEEAGELVLTYRTEGQDVCDFIRLSSIPTAWGSRDWFMHCPATGRRARKLYKWEGLPHFRHRDAVRPRPTYASQRDSGSDRIIRQRWALRQKLGDDMSDLFGEPFKPKWKRWRTFNRIAQRDAELEAREDSLPHPLARLLEK